MNKINRLVALLALISLSACANTKHEHKKLTTEFVTTELVVTGAVESPLRLTVSDLRKLTQHEVNMGQLVCQSGDKVGDLGKIKGVRLKDIIEKAVVKTEEHNDVKKMVIIATASDDYKVVYSWTEIFNSPLGDGVIVFIEQNGKPLSDEEGKIAMVSTKDTRTGPRHVKWLNGIEVKKIVE